MIIPSKKVARGIIFDTITLVTVAALVLGNTIGAAVHLVAMPGRAAWQVALDWITIAIFAAAAALAVYLSRRVMARAYEAEARRRALHAKIRRGDA